jgi:hypothetical protein
MVTNSPEKIITHILKRRLHSHWQRKSLLNNEKFSVPANPKPKATRKLVAGEVIDSKKGNSGCPTLYLHSGHGLPDNGFPLFRCGSPYITQVYFVVLPHPLATLLFDEGMHLLNGRPLLRKGSDMHYLGALSLMEGLESD